MRLGMGEMLVVLVVALLVFGPNKLPQLGDALGKGIRNFKRAASQDDAPPATQDASEVMIAQAQLTEGSSKAPLVDSITEPSSTAEIKR